MIIRLCRRRKEHRHIFLRQIAKRLNGFERRRKQFCRQALRFIENDYRIRQPMQFPKIRGFCRKQPLEKSHGCGHNDWHIPALCKLSLLFCQLPLAMIFQQNVIPKDFPIFNCILFRQRNKRQHNDDSLLTVLAALEPSRWPPIFLGESLASGTSSTSSTSKGCSKTLAM